jgi:hypothetical protein
LSGPNLEKLKSLEFHAEGIPLLISPQLLRSRELGQLDLVRMKKKNGWVIEIAEVKSSVTGVLALERGQRKRIISAGNFLSAIFGAPTKLIVPTN